MPALNLPLAAQDLRRLQSAAFFSPRPLKSRRTRHLRTGFNRDFGGAFFLSTDSIATGGALG